MVSYEIVGSIAVVQDKEIAGQILKQNKNVKTIAIRTGEVEGPYRIKKVKVIAGEKTTETIHKENGVRLLVDINKVYFSPRLQTERQRIINKVKEGEVIIDMFAGAGPFSIEIAKNTRAKKIYAIDFNPDAIKYLKENIKMNKVENIVPILGNALEAIKDLPKADRIIMNAPRQNNNETLSAAAGKLKKKGTIHFYISSELLPAIDLSRFRVVEKRRVIDYAPGKSHFCLDLQNL